MTAGSTDNVADDSTMISGSGELMAPEPKSTARDFSDPAVLLSAWNSWNNDDAGVVYHDHVISTDQLRISCFAGISQEEGRYWFMLTLPARPHVEMNFRVVDVRLGNRRDLPGWEKWTLTFTLLDSSLLMAFAEVCAALVRRLSGCVSWRQANFQISHVFVQFHRLVSLVQGSEQLIRGTIAELAAMPAIAEYAGLTLDEVIASWTGPFGAAQDFRVVSLDRGFEVKSLPPSAHSVTVSSQYQLDSEGLSSIDLITVRLVEQRSAKGNRQGSRAAVSPQSWDVSSLVSWLLKRTSNPGQAEEHINSGLDELGLSFFSDGHHHSRYVIGDVTIYRVCDDFPRITSHQVARGVEDLSYKLDLGIPQVSSHKVKQYKGLVNPKSRGEQG